MSRRSWAVGLLSLLLACGGVDGTGMPAGEHVHSLGVTADEGLLLGLHGGLFRSEDGAAWEPVGLRGEDAMVITTSAGEPVFVAGHEVLYRSDDAGQTFSPMEPEDLPGMDIHGFAQARSDGRVVYAFVVGFGLFASDDAGETWEQRASIEEMPPDAFGLAVGGSGTETVVMVGPESGVIRSEDGGRTFESVFDAPSWALATTSEASNAVWALTAAGLARSDDTGSTWEVVSTFDGTERLGGLQGQPVTLAVADEVVWVVTEQPRALYRSNDAAATWERVDAP